MNKDEMIDRDMALLATDLIERQRRQINYQNREIADLKRQLSMEWEETDAIYALSELWKEDKATITELRAEVEFMKNNWVNPTGE